MAGIVPYPQENTTNFVFSPFTTRKGAGERKGRGSVRSDWSTQLESLNSSTHKGGGGGGEGTGVEEERLRGGVGEEGGRDMTQREERDTDTDKQSGEWKKKKSPSFLVVFWFWYIFFWTVYLSDNTANGNAVWHRVYHYWGEAESVVWWQLTTKSRRCSKMTENGGVKCNMVTITSW